MMMEKNLLFIGFIFLLLLGCNKKNDDENLTPTNDQEEIVSTDTFPKTLVSYEKVEGTPVSKDLLKIIAGNYGFKTTYNDKEWTNYDVIVYKVIYKTMLDGELVNTAGLVSFPSGEFDKTTPMPTLLGCHGTVFKKEDVPSNIEINLLTQTFKNISGFELISSNGFMAVIPDYIGFATSRDYLHPYYIKDVAATTNIDMLYAASEVASKEGYTISQDLYLTGYSEGGFTSVATLEHIEANEKKEFNLKGTYSGAGGYLPAELIKTVSADKNYAAPAYLFYVTYSYEQYKEWPSGEKLTDIYVPEFANSIPTLLDGTKGFSEINKAVADENLETLLLADVLKNIRENNKDYFIQKGLESNGFSKTKIDSKLFLYQSKEDQVIPFENTETAALLLKLNGSESVQLIEVKGDHGDAGSAMFEDTLERILEEEN